MRFYAESETKRGGKYLVDLSEDGGNGRCGCPDFEIRVQKNRRDKTGRRSCKHLQYVFAYFGWLMARQIVAEQRRKL